MHFRIFEFSFDLDQIDKGAVYQLIKQNPERRRFIQKYFEKYPDWPLVRMKKPSPSEKPAQAVVVCEFFLFEPLKFYLYVQFDFLGLKAYDRNQDRVTAYVVSTDRALCVLRFPPRSSSISGANCFDYPCEIRGHLHLDETIFRGSSRIHAVARKSSVPVRVEGDLRDALSYEMDPATLAIRLKKEALIDLLPILQFDILPCNQPLPHVVWQYHTECTPVCLAGLDRDPADPQFYKCSPLHIPLLCGWRRMLYVHESSLRRGCENRILYRAPCGRSLISKKYIATYLREVGSELTIDLFCFDPAIETKNFVHENPYAADSSTVACSEEQFFSGVIDGVEWLASSCLDKAGVVALYPSCLHYQLFYRGLESMIPLTLGFWRFWRSPDFAGGMENMPIPVVNTVDDDDPPKAARALVGAFQVFKKFGEKITLRELYAWYSYRALLGKTITGIYECNDNCGCQHKRCYNRVVQQPIKYPIQIYKTAQSGWGVRTLCDIPAGAFIANYVGALLTDSLADALQGEDEYFADLDLNDAVENEKATTLEKCGYLDMGLGSSDDEINEPVKPRIDAAAAISDDTMFKWSDYFGENNTLFVVDAKKKGNVGRTVFVGQPVKGKKESVPGNKRPQITLTLPTDITPLVNVEFPCALPGCQASAVSSAQLIISESITSVPVCIALQVRMLVCRCLQLVRFHVGVPTELFLETSLGDFRALSFHCARRENVEWVDRIPRRRYQERHLPKSPLMN
ncbi:unnamed protein product [Angiostrongylus costaricensis]|uniref:MBD domain-containing protein n=1 Tax=Angiostrongylus costaricensis TaxID=334426 RepID=A0A158PJ90_ANGCS|nr:unnamed protein product [Angiostrongylus costaricensis]